MAPWEGEWNSLRRRGHRSSFPATEGRQAGDAFPLDNHVILRKLYEMQHTFHDAVKGSAFHFLSPGSGPMVLDPDEASGFNPADCAIRPAGIDPVTRVGGEV